MSVFLVLAAILVTCPRSANASIVDFEYTGTVGSAQTPGIASGDVVTINVFADNGSPSLLNQIWTGSDILDVTLQAGTYSATYSGGSDSIFATDGSGDLYFADLSGNDPNSPTTDNFGTATAPLLFANDFCDTTDRRCNSFNPILFFGNWTVTEVAAVPESSTWAMMILGFCGLGFVAYRRKQNGLSFRVA